MEPKLREMMGRAIEQATNADPSLDLEGLNEVLGQVTDRYNRMPQADMEGLSPEAMVGLLYDQWDGPQSCLRVRDDLDLGLLVRSRYLGNARVLLSRLAENGGAKATAAGNLNRTSVQQILPLMQLSEVDELNLRYRRGQLNEGDIHELPVLRTILRLAGLLRKSRGSFYCTKKAAAMLAEDRAGELQALLFVTVFRKVEVALFSGRGGDLSGINHTVSYSIYVLSRVSDDWHELPSLAERILHPRIRELVIPGREHDAWYVLAYHPILRPLESLGLLEIDSRLGDMHRNGPPRIRKTPLFDRMLEFAVTPGPARSTTVWHPRTRT